MLPPCKLSPDSGTIDSSGGLTIDYNANSPSYHGTGATSWPSTYSCPSGTFPSTAVAVYFAGSNGVGKPEAAGTLSPDGLTIAGSDLNGSVSSTWHFIAD